jgi:geranylgeranyl diphosphate synthase type II
MQQEFLSQAKLVEDRLDKLTQVCNLSYRSLFEAARYSLLTTGGKRLRPILALSAIHDLKGDYKGGIDIAAAIEMIHTYSLIHDDLPCMDNDDFRRGKPSLHKVYPEWKALLAGDFLLTLAFETLVESNELSDHQKVAIISLFSKKAGAHGMIGGQVIDLEKTGKNSTINELKEMHKLKTAALMVLALQSAAIVCNLSLDESKYLTAFGEKIGLAYQIIDDVLDVGGKNSDASNDKSTYATFYGIEEAKKQAFSLYEEALNDLNFSSKPHSLLKALAKLLIYRSN